MQSERTRRIDRIADRVELVLKWVGTILAILGVVSIAFYFYDHDQHSSTVLRVGIFHIVWIIVLGVIYIGVPWDKVFRFVCYDWFECLWTCCGCGDASDRSPYGATGAVYAYFMALIIAGLTFGNSASVIHSRWCKNHEHVNYVFAEECIGQLPTLYRIIATFNYIAVFGQPALICLYFVLWVIITNTKRVGIGLYRHFAGLFRCCPELNACKNIRALFGCASLAKVVVYLCGRLSDTGPTLENPIETEELINTQPRICALVEVQPVGVLFYNSP